jgi:hypothetical protein
MANEKTKETVTLCTYLKNPQEAYAEIIYDLQNLGYDVAISPLQKTGSPHDLKEPTLISPQNHEFEGEEQVAKWLYHKAKDLRVALENRLG